jgi:quercetin dioxygenase-like cupin family protein
MKPGDLLLLYPGGYPVQIDVAQEALDGQGTAMHFLLPPRAHNFPLTHSREHKLVVALAGSLRVQRGSRTLAQLHRGEAVLIPPNGAHRIRQDGLEPSLVGVALWPGAVEQAFRALAALVASNGFQRAEVAALFADYGVAWEAGPPDDGQPCAIAKGTFIGLLPALPDALAAALAKRWASWLSTPP